MSELTDREQQMCRIAGKEGAVDTLRALGVNVDEPREAQQDFAWLARTRKARDKGVLVFVAVLVTSVVTGTLALVWDKVTG